MFNELNQKIKPKKAIYIALVIAVIATSIWWVITPSSYEECVLKNIKNVAEDNAGLVHRVCRNKFPKKYVKQNTRDLTGQELIMLDGRASKPYSRLNQYTVNLHNGTDVTITEIDIGIGSSKASDKGKSNNSSDDFNGPYTVYRNEVTIPPKTAKEFSFEFVPGEPGSRYHWVIIRAKGY
jgi:hypothetical protein